MILVETNNNRIGVVTAPRQIDNMRNYLRVVFIFLVFLSASDWSFSQNEPLRPGGKIRIDLANLPISESELKAELLARGIELEHLDPERLAEYAGLIEEIIQDLMLKGRKVLSLTKDTVYQIIRDTVLQSVGTTSVAAPAVVVPTPAVPSSAPDSMPPSPPSPAPDYTCSGEGIYGQHIFTDKTIELFEISDDVKAPDFYILGAGDEITVTIFGVSQADLRYTINNEGYISPEGMHRIFLKGVTFGEAQRLLRQRFSLSYNFVPEQFTARITSVRNIIVNIFGEAVKNGSYTIPAINTAFNAIVAAEGPTTLGSVRNIQLIRNGKVKILDVYEFLLDPSIAFDYQLQHNDIIYIPAAEKEVSIQGAVNRPCRYELEDGEDIFDLIDYAGGLKEYANTENIQITRYQDNEHILVDVNLKEQIMKGDTIGLLKGDTVMVKTITRPYENFVTVKGEVEVAGKFALESGMRLSNLITKAKLRAISRTDVAYLIRTNLDKTSNVIRVNLDEVLKETGTETDLLLEPQDELIVFDRKKFAEKATVSVLGAVREPTTMPYDVDESMRLQDLLLLGGGLQPNAAQFGYIKRKDPSNKEKVDYVKVDLFAAMQDTASIENTYLKPFDELVVYTKEKFYDLYRVEVEGAVREAGVFDFDEEFYLSELVYLAGGLTQEATGWGYILRSNIENPEEKTYIRINIKAALTDKGLDFLLRPMDYLLVLDNRNFTDVHPVKVLGAVRNPGEYNLGDSLTIRDIITLAGGLKYEAEANHIDLYRLNLQDSVEQAYKFVTTFAIDSSYNLIDTSIVDSIILDSAGIFHFKPYDHIIVRQKTNFEMQELVKIEGEVKYPGYYVLTQENQKIADLIEEAGGLTDEAFKSGATLYRTSENRGFVVLRLKDAIKDPKSKHNIILKEGDLITIPKQEDLVYIRVKGTVAGHQYPEKFLDNGMISVAYHGTHNAKWYIENFAAGFARNAKRKLVTVEKPNHRIHGTKRLLPFMTYPKVTKGSTVTVGLKKPKRRRRGGGTEDEPVNWEKTLATALTSVTSVFSLIILLNQVGN